MPALQRSISLRGPMFYRAPLAHAATCALHGPPPKKGVPVCDCEAEAVLLFVNHLDGSTRDGPRPATAEDANAHTEAYERFLNGDDPAPLGALVSFSTPADTVGA